MDKWTTWLTKKACTSHIGSPSNHRCWPNVYPVPHIQEAVMRQSFNEAVLETWKYGMSGDLVPKDASRVVLEPFICILDTQGLQSPPCADHHKLLKSWFFFFNKFVISWTLELSQFARRTRLLWPLMLNHYLGQWSVFIWRNRQSLHSTFHINLHLIVQRDPRTSYF
jgi:hypothetical protein